MFSDDIYDAGVSIPNFTLHRADRATRKGDSSNIYLRAQLFYTAVQIGKVRI